MPANPIQVLVYQAAPLFMTDAQMAEYLSISESTLTRVATRHGLKKVYLNGRSGTRRWRVADIDRWAATAPTDWRDVPPD